MHNKIYYFLILPILFISLIAQADDNIELKMIFDQDQEIRENTQKGGKPPSVKSDRDRRIKVFEIIANNELKTANDYIHALVIMQHTTLMFDANETLISMSSENHLLGFQLAKKAHQLGHKLGSHFLTWTYNYFVQGVGCDQDKFGFDLIDGYIVARNKTLQSKVRADSCGWFDPIPTYKDLGLIKI